MGTGTARCDHRTRRFSYRDRWSGGLSLLAARRAGGRPLALAGRWLQRPSPLRLSVVTSTLLGGPMHVTVAAVQATPVFLDRDATAQKSCELIAKAAANGARLIAFPETFIPTYPDWVWRTKPWTDASWWSRLLDQSVVVPSEVTELLGAAARDAEAYVAMG